MGSFLGSIHVRTADATAVGAAVSQLAEAEGRRFLVSPALDGWVGVYHEEDQDLTVIERLARLLPAPMIQLVVHDDDIFAYVVFLEGARADQYDSTPGYFGDEDIAEAPGKPTGGSAEALSRLTVHPERLEDVVALLAKPHEQFLFEQERLRRFADLLGIPNAATSYRYLMRGERHGIRDWRSFTRYPDPAAERREKLAASARLRDAWRGMAKDGRLLAVYSTNTGPRKKLAIHGYSWTVDPRRGAVLFRRVAVPGGVENPLLRIAPPWTEPPTPIVVDLPPQAYRLRVSPSGRWLAGGLYQSGVALRDLHGGRQSHELPRGCKWFDFTSDGEDLAVLSSDVNWSRVDVYAVSDGTLKTSIDFGGLATGAVLHPTRSFMVSWSHDSRELALLDLDGAKVRVLVRGTQEEATRLGEVDSSWIATMRAREDRTLLEEIGPAQLAEVQRRLRQLGGRLNQRLAGFMSATFTADGAYLICATQAGLLIHDVASMLAADTRMPDPVLSCMTGLRYADTAEEFNHPPIVYQAAVDEPNRRVLFSTSEGAVGFLHLGSGESGELLRLPEPYLLFEMALLPERESLVLCGRGPLARKDDHWKLMVWDYPALCRRAGLAW